MERLRKLSACDRAHLHQGQRKGLVGREFHTVTGHGSLYAVHMSPRLGPACIPCFVGHFLRAAMGSVCMTPE